LRIRGSGTPENRTLVLSQGDEMQAGKTEIAEDATRKSFLGKKERTVMNGFAGGQLRATSRLGNDGG